MSDMQLNINADVIKGLELLQQSISCFLKGAKTETDKAPEKPLLEEETSATMQAAPHTIRQEQKQTEPEIESPVVNIDEIRRVFAKILLDDKVNGREMIRNELQSHQAKKLSEVNPDAYFSVITNVVSKYAADLKKADPAHFDAKIEEMKTWSIPF